MSSFSPQDSRFMPSPAASFDTYGVAEMMADLGTHRRAALPLSGSTTILPPPPPDISKHSPRVAKLAEDHPDIPNAWASLFDPKLVEERDDGLGEGQMHRSGPNYQPYNNSNKNHSNHNDDNHRRGPHRSGHYPTDQGSRGGRNSSPPIGARTLRHARSLFELSKLPPEIPFFTRGPLDSVRTVSGLALLQRRAALRAEMSSMHSPEGLPGDPLAPLRAPELVAGRKRSLGSRGVHNIVKHHLAGNARIPLRAQAALQRRDAPPNTPPINTPPINTPNGQSSMEVFALPPKRPSPLPSHLSARAVRNPEVSQWNTGKLVTNSVDYDYLPNPPKPASSLFQGLPPVKLDHVPSSGSFFLPADQETADRASSSGRFFRFPGAARADTAPSSENSFQTPSQEKTDLPIVSGVSAIPDAPRKRSHELASSQTYPAVAPGPVLFPLVQKTPETAKSSIFPGTIFPPKTGPIPRHKATQHNLSSTKPQSEATRTPPLQFLELNSIVINNESVARGVEGSLEVHANITPSNPENSSEEDDTTVESLHNDMSALRESVNNLKTEVSSIDGFEQSLQTRIATMMLLKEGILREIETKEVTMSQIERELQNIKTKRDTLKKAVAALTLKTENVVAEVELPVTVNESLEMRRPDVEMEDFAKDISQGFAQQEDSSETKSPQEQSTSEMPSDNEPIEEEYSEVGEQAEAASEAQTDESLVKSRGKDEKYSIQETKETKLPKINEPVTRINFQAESATQLPIEPKVETAADKSIESYESQDIPRDDRSAQKTTENIPLVEARSQEQRSETTQESDASGSFKTQSGMDSAEKILVADLRTQERAAEIEAFQQAEKERLEIKRLIKEHLERVKHEESRRKMGKPKIPGTDDGSSDEKEIISPIKASRAAMDAHRAVFRNVDQGRYDLYQSGETGHETVDETPLRKATEPKEEEEEKTIVVGGSGVLNQATSPRNSVIDYAASEHGQSKPRRPRFPYHISLDLRPTYEVDPLRVEVGLNQSPEEEITKRCMELMTPAGYQNLIRMPKLRVFLDQCNKRHASRLTRYHASG